MRIFLFFHLKGNYVIKIGTRQDRYVSMREFSNHTVFSISDSTMAASSKYTQDLSVQIVSFTFSFKWFLLLGCNLSYIVDLFAALHELASASARTLLKLASPVRALLKPYGDTLKRWLKDVAYAHTVPLKSKLPSSRETRFSSRETKVSSRLSSRESLEKL